MKQLFLLLGVFSASVFTTAEAQKKYAEGHLDYTINITGLDAGSPAYQSLNGASLHIYLKPSQSRTEMVSALGTESSIYDSRAKSGFLLKEYSGQKLMITLNGDNWKQKNQFYEEANFSIDNSRTIIAGQSCKKATASLPGNKTLVVYFNPEIELVNTTYNNAFPNLPGLPVQYELQSGNLNFRYTLKEVSWEPVSSAKFEVPRTGYRVMTYDENQQLKKGN